MAQSLVTELSYFFPQIKLAEYARALIPRGIRDVQLRNTEGGRKVVVIEYGEEGGAAIDVTRADDEASKKIESIVRDISRAGSSSP